MTDSGKEPESYSKERGSVERKDHFEPRRRLLLLAVFSVILISGQILLAIAENQGSTLLLAVMWISYAVSLLVVLVKAAPTEQGCGVYIAVLICVVAAFYLGKEIREGSILLDRGKEATVVVAEQREDSSSRGNTKWYLTLQLADGSPLDGPEMKQDSPREVGEKFRAVTDPEGVLPPQTPGRVDVLGEKLTFAGLIAICIGGAVWGTFRRSKDKKSQAKDSSTSTPSVEEEEELIRVLRARQFDRRGYIRVSPSNFPTLSHLHAARIAQAEGLLTEEFGNKGYWRFGSVVIERMKLD